MLYRLTYVREGRPRSCTFWAADLAFAARFSELWEQLTKAPVLTLTPLGSSKFSQPAYARLHQARPGGRTTPLDSEKAVETSADFGF